MCPIADYVEHSYKTYTLTAVSSGVTAAIVAVAVLVLVTVVTISSVVAVYCCMR